ncbi:cupin domain-containing protein [Sporosarcina sp. Marseille-Q4943]|uniref:cupin domain-containing protein n=1 Tax=Sporosarcina sp. Marseille-Q4943 TaxID=2942204 RepID=UPI00208DC779|nr:cupin domain-containing protein [Sporosarcina sp. Marseille-Q4943]
MKIIRLDELEGKNITQYDSRMIMRKILMTEKPSHVGIMDLPKNGLVGYHEASVPQMVIILEGEGWVRTGNEEKVKVSAGDVVLWGKGEGHETTTENGMKAIIIESEGLDIGSF